MSLTVDYETEIRIPQPQLRAAQGNVRGLPCMNIMRQALETITREQGGSVTENYEDCNGNRCACVMALRTPQFPRGVGVDITSEGKVIFRYDEEGGVAPAARSLCDDVCRVYATIAVLHAQKKLGYRVTARDVSEPGGRKQVIISATRD